MSHSTKSILLRLSTGKSTAMAVEKVKQSDYLPNVPLNKPPALSMADALADCLTPRKGDPALTPH